MSEPLSTSAAPTASRPCPISIPVNISSVRVTAAYTRLRSGRSRTRSASSGEPVGRVIGGNGTLPNRMASSGTAPIPKASTQSSTAAVPAG